MKKQTTKQQTKQTAAMKSRQTALLYRLGPSRPVVKMTRARDTENAYVLVLKCGHKRTATKRATLRCRRCRKGGK